MKIKSCLVLLAAVLLLLGVWAAPGWAQYISVNNGAPYTTSRNVALTLSDEGAGAVQMKFCDESTPNSWTAPESYATTKNWLLNSGDGEKTVWVRFLYSNGTFVDVGDSIFLDTNPPLGTIAINNGDQYTNTDLVTLTLSAADTIGSVTQMRFSNYNINWSAWEIYRTTRYDWTLPVVDGSKTVFAQFRDEAGNISSSVSDNITLDMTAPAGCSVRINGGAGATPIINVTLTLAAAGADEVRFSNDNSTWTQWEGYTPTKAWNLLMGEGLKTVYVQFRDSAGNLAFANSGITLDNTAPTGSMAINGGAAKTASRNVTLNLAINGAAQMRFSNSSTFTGVPWEEYHPTKDWELTAGESLKTVFAQFQDAAGNSYPVTDAIYLDPNPPLGTVTINNGALYTNDLAVTLNLTTNDANQMRFSNDGVGWSSWSDYAASAPWVLTTGNGLKTVYVQFKDDLGNTSGSFTDTITLDRSAPTGSIAINNGAAVTNNRQVTLGLSVADGGSGLDKMSFSEDGTNFNAPENFAPTKTWTLTAGDGDKIVYARCTDRAGNAATFASTITLDATVPTGTVTINGGAAATNTTSVTLTTDAPNASLMRFSNNGTTWSAWEPYPAIKAWTLTSGDGPKTVYAQFRDAAGNTSASVSDTITLNTAGLTGSMIINGGAPYTTGLQVTLTLSAPGATQMAISGNGTSWPWEAYSTTKLWGLDNIQGLKTVYAKFKNAAGTESAVVTASITLDSRVPTGSIVINNNAGATNNPRVNLGLTAADTGSGLDKMAFSNDGVTFSPPEAIAAAKVWNLATGDGLKTVSVRYTDKAGNAAVFSSTISLDTTAPSGTITINSGAAYTTFTRVTLALNAPGAIRMRFSNDNSTWSGWIPYVQLDAWDLASGDGLKTVYAQFKDSLENISDSALASITLDTTPPVGAVLINGGAAHTNLYPVSLTLAATGATQMRFSNTGVFDGVSWENYAASKAWSLDTNGNDGPRTVYVQFKDEVGNICTVSDSISLDTLPPTGSILINDGAIFTSTIGVTLRISNTGASQMCFSNDNSTWSAWEPCATSKPWILPGGDGNKTVYCQFKDEAENLSGVGSSSITLRTSWPAGTVAINGGASYTKTANVLLSITASAGLQMRLSNNSDFSGAAWENVLAAKSWTLGAGDGVKRVYAQFKDGAGNFSPAASAQIVLDATVPRDGALTATPGGGAVALNWSGYTDATSGLKTYRLYYDANDFPAASGTPIYQGTDLSFNHAGLDLKKNHFYRLAAEDQAGNISPGATAQTSPNPKAKGSPHVILLLLEP
jgi:hypothetical protein